MKNLRKRTLVTKNIMTRMSEGIKNQASIGNHEDSIHLEHDHDHDNEDSESSGVEVDENKIYFYSMIGEKEILELNRIVKRLDVEMQYLGMRLNCVSPPVEIHIHSPGGSIFAGLSAFDTIKKCKSEIHTYVEGSAASAATLISAAGTKRFIYKNAFMLIHQPQLAWSGKHDEFLDEIENQKKIYRKILDVYLEKVKISEEKLIEMMNHELWIDAEQAIELGFADEIY